MPTVKEVLGDEFATLIGQGKSQEEIIQIAQQRYNEQKEVLGNTTIVQPVTKSAPCECMTNDLIGIGFVLVLFIAALYTLRLFIMYIQEQVRTHKKSFLSPTLYKVVYTLVGFTIFLFPPQYYKKDFYYNIYGKFAFITNVKQIDYYVFSFEIIGYLLMGAVMYLLWIKGIPKRSE